jgi:DNA-binding transcriptional LysR family regulator
LEAAAAERGITLTPAIEAEGREAVRELVAARAGVGFVSGAEFVPDGRLVTVALEQPLMMEEALICLRERRGGKMVRAFLDIARQINP